MSQAFEDKSVDFIAVMARSLDELSGGSDHRAECVIEASNLVAAFIDADGRHTSAELDAWVGAIGVRLRPAMIVTPQQLRDDDTFSGRKVWLNAPSTMFDLLVKADAKDTGRRANEYYTLALSLAHATAALDLMPSPTEIAAIDRFRSMLLREMDGHGVPRPDQRCVGCRSDGRPEEGMHL